MKPYIPFASALLVIFVALILFWYCASRDVLKYRVAGTRVIVKTIVERFSRIDTTYLDTMSISIYDSFLSYPINGIKYELVDTLR